jgi:crotonobetainyl-CoA:carnitine CoA-transferase CaiB-like acyl-CoA transferase
MVESPAGDSSRARGPYPRGMEGNPEASGLFLYLNANKKGVTLDLEAPGERETFFQLIETADVLVHNTPLRDAGRLGLDVTTIETRAPRLVHTWVTPFGLSGPHRDWAAENLTLVAAGGWASVSPGNSPYADFPPLAPFGHQADFQAANHAAVATMGALFARRKTGKGQLVEVSEQECIAAALELAGVTYTYTGLVASRLGVRTSAPMGIYDCKGGGLIFVMTADPHQWEALKKMIGNPEWTEWEIFDDRFKRGINQDVLRPLLAEWIAERTVEEVFDLAAEYRIPFAPVSNIADLIKSPHLKARGFFAEIRHPVAGDLTMPGAPYVMPRTPWSLRTPAPLLGQHNAEVLGALKKKVTA